MRAKKPQDPRMRLTRNLRKGVSIQRRHSVEYVGDGNEKLTCRQCGLVTVQPVGGTAGAMTEAMAKKLANYRGDASGVLGRCPRCTRWEAEIRFPHTFDALPGIKRGEHVIHMKVGTHSLQAVYINEEDETDLRVGRKVTVREMGSNTQPFAVVVTADVGDFFRADRM